MLLSVVLVPIRVVGNLASLFSLLGFIVVNIAIIRLRRQKPDLSRPFSIPFYPIPPILGILLNLLLGIYISPKTWVIAIAWLAFGGVVYLGWNRYKRRDAASTTDKESTRTTTEDEA